MSALTSSRLGRHRTAHPTPPRLPPPHRLSPTDAWALIQANFIAQAKVVALEADHYADLLRRAATQEVAGGRTYDVVIGECARRAGSAVLLTFNRRHFDPPPAGVSVTEPPRASPA